MLWGQMWVEMSELLQVLFSEVILLRMSELLSLLLSELVWVCSWRCCRCGCRC